MSVDTEGYQTIWYKLHTAPGSGSKWPGILQLSELLFSLLFANSHVERLFSTLKVIKTDRRSQLQTETLSDLLEIRVAGPPLADFSPDEAISLWWKDCQERINNQGQNTGQGQVDHQVPHHLLRHFHQTLSILRTGIRYWDVLQTLTLWR